MGVQKILWIAWPRGGLVIATPFRGKKIGTQVLNWIEMDCKASHLDRCSLAVSPFNLSALTFYNRNGYEFVREETHYFGQIKPNISRFILEKNIM